MKFLRDFIQFGFIILPLHNYIIVVKSQWTESTLSVPLRKPIGVTPYFAGKLNGDAAEFAFSQGHGNSQRDYTMNHRVRAVTAHENGQDIDLWVTRDCPSPPHMLLVQQLRGGGILVRTNRWIGSSRNRCWTSLALAIAIEICATTMMKIASDESCIKRTMLSTVAYLTSLFLFGSSLAQIDVGIAYAIWSALGTLFVSVAGAVMFGEQFTAIKVVSMILILVGVVGLNYKSR